jgi:hypothetical protein
MQNDKGHKRIADLEERVRNSEFDASATAKTNTAMLEASEAELREMYR